jgi:hypothetical protein
MSQNIGAAGKTFEQASDDDAGPMVGGEGKDVDEAKDEAQPAVDPADDEAEHQ